MAVRSILFGFLITEAAILLTCMAVTPDMMLKSRKNIDDFHVQRLAEAVKNTRNISSECTQALIALETSNNSALLKTYADAIGKPGAGIQVGGLAWLGSYSECKVIPDATYCLTGIGIKPQNGSTNNINPFAGGVFKWGLCVPKQCSETDIAIGLKDIIAALGLSSSFQLTPDLITLLMAPEMKTVNCAKPSKYTSGAVATITLCGVILLLCLCGTIIEIMSSYKLTKKAGFRPISNNESPEEQNSFKGGETDNNFANYSKEPLVAYLDESNSTQGFAKELFLCFSLIRNAKQILNTNVPASAITSINGMRVLSIFWVILGHTFLWQLISGIDSNVLEEFTILQRFTFQAIVNASVSVDSFFFLSGLLVAYLSFRQMEKNKGQLNLFKFYFHRFWRLTPVYMFVLLFFDQMIGFLGEGPIWYQLQTKQPCDKYWWTNLLYINNFYPTKFQNSCMNWTWYLANDMQFYIISPVIIFAAYRFGKGGLLASTGLLMSACVICTGVIMSYFDFNSAMFGGGEVPGNPDDQADYQSYVYVKPYCRIAPYLIGMLLGYMFHVIKDGRVSHLLFYLFGWCAAIILALTPLYGTYKAYKKDPQPLTHAENVLYATFSRISWSLALAWVIYACHVGYGGLVNSILSARFWIPLSRLTYCVYLVHIIILEAYFASHQTVTYYSDVNVAWQFLACTTTSYLVAFIVSVTCEVPMMHLEKLIFKTDRKRH